MPNRKNYPKWFNIYVVPCLYDFEPTKTLSKRTILEKKTLGAGDALPKDGDWKIDSISDDDVYGAEVQVIKVKIEEVPNKNYERELKVYLRKKEKHKKKLAEWKEWKKKWDEEVAAEEESHEKNLYKKLQKKYG